MRLLLLALTCFLSSSLFATPKHVLIIRHAEKPETGNILDVKGLERAAALSPFFRCDPRMTAYGSLEAIYAMGQSHDDDTSIRPIQTITPLAYSLQMTPITEYKHSQYPKMVADILKNPLYEGKTLLICWSHEMIPPMTKAFGVTGAPAQWDSKVFDRVWVITFDEGGSLSFCDLPQRLLFGDSEN